MDFKVTRIPYIGREKYPSNGNSTSVRGIVQNYFGGGGAAIAGGSSVNPNGDYDDNRGNNATSFFCYLSKSNNVFDRTLLPSTDIAYVYGYKNMDAAQVLVGDISTSAETANYDITGIPSGMTVVVSGNGTTAATIYFHIDDSIEVGEGILTIPVAININQTTLDPSHYTFWFYKQNCMTMNLTYHYSVIDSGKQKGPAIRGPYDYYAYSGTTRDWCNGVASNIITDSDKWIDVVQKDGVYYYCSTAYNGTPLGANIANWTSGQSFDFIASNLIMASAASINFLTGNELYLMDSNNNITGGAMGGDGINFWAGDSQPSLAPFRVANDGTMHASRGVFQGTVSAATIYASDIILNGNALKLSGASNTFMISDEEIEVEVAPEDITIPLSEYTYGNSNNAEVSGIVMTAFTAMGDTTIVLPPASVDLQIEKTSTSPGSEVNGTIKLSAGIFSGSSNPLDFSQAICSGFSITPFQLTQQETSKNAYCKTAFSGESSTDNVSVQCTDNDTYIIAIKWVMSSIGTDETRKLTFNKWTTVNSPNPVDEQFFNIGKNGMQIFLGDGFYFTAARDANQGPVIAMGGQNTNGQMFGLRLTRENGIQILTGKPGEGWHTPS